MGKILTTHVGLLPRSQRVVDFLFAKEREESIDDAAYQSCLCAEVDTISGKQVATGIDWVSNEEMSKISYAPNDLKLFPGFLDRLSKSGGTPRYSRTMCSAPVVPKGQDELLRDIGFAKLRALAEGASLVV